MDRFLTIVLLLVALATQGQNANETFNEAKLYLANHKLDEAIPILEKLWKKDQKNANLNYLLGLCYVKTDKEIPMAVELLETASEIYTAAYQSGSSQERRAPEYVYYYLTIAYSKQGECEKALRALNQFYSVYSYQDEYYLVDGQKWVRECNLEKREDAPGEMPLLAVDSVSQAKPDKLVEALPDTASAPAEFPEPTPRLASSPKIKERLVPFTDWETLQTKKISYTTMSSLYGVQVGALMEPRPTREFQNLKNVEVYVDENGIFRYVIGRFPYRSQAVTLLNKVKEAGYPDAFIVDVNQPLYSTEVVGVGPSNISWEITGEVEYRVQIGAFHTIVPGWIAEQYLEIDGIHENIHGGFTILTVGNYKTYDKAAAHRDKLSASGLPDAFVVAFNNGRKIPLKAAIEYTEKIEPDPMTDEDIEALRKRKKADF